MKISARMEDDCTAKVTVESGGSQWQTWCEPSDDSQINGAANALARLSGAAQYDIKIAILCAWEERHMAEMGVSQ